MICYHPTFLENVFLSPVSGLMYYEGVSESGNYFCVVKMQILKSIPKHPLRKEQHPPSPIAYYLLSTFLLFFVFVFVSLFVFSFLMKGHIVYLN